MSRRVTIKDIAKVLGVSKSTVSRALTDRYDVKPETRDAVMSMAEKMHYRPNVTALNFMNQNTKIIGVIVPEFLNSFFPRVIIEIKRFFEKYGYNVLITQSDESVEEERKNLKLMEDAMVEGLIISVVHRNRNLDYYQLLEDSGMPIVFFNRHSDMPNSTQVVINDGKMAFFAVEHLIYQGKCKIMHLAGPADLKNTMERETGYEQALTKHGIAIDKELIVEGGMTRESGYKTMKSCLEKEVIPDAVFAFNDPSAIGAMQAIKRFGYRIPQDIAVVGFSESRSATMIDPPLTSVEQPLSELGETAARLLLEKLQNSEILPKVIVLDAKLNVRESSDENANTFGDD